MAELDFSKIFASTSPLTPYTWSDSDYLTGWNTVGGTPPARTQFDALQNMTDRKLKHLNDTKAPLDSPTFTGTPKAPTPAKTDNSTRIATTAWGRQWVSQLQSDISTAIASIDLSGYAPINSPHFTGIPQAATPTDLNDYTDRLATTKWVNQVVTEAKKLITTSYSHYMVVNNGSVRKCIQWGAGVFGPGETEKTITFPISFQTGYGKTLIVANRAGAVLSYDFVSDNISFKITVKDRAGATNINFDWLAIGDAV